MFEEERACRELRPVSCGGGSRVQGRNVDGIEANDVKDGLHGRNRLVEPVQNQEACSKHDGTCGIIRTVRCPKKGE